MGLPNLGPELAPPRLARRPRPPRGPGGLDPHRAHVHVPSAVFGSGEGAACCGEEVDVEGLGGAAGGVEGGWGAGVCETVEG